MRKKKKRPTNIHLRLSPATSRRMVRSSVPGFGTTGGLPLDVSTDHGIDATAAAAVAVTVDAPAPSPPPPPPPFAQRVPFSLFSAHLWLKTVLKSGKLPAGQGTPRSVLQGFRNLAQPGVSQGGIASSCDWSAPPPPPPRPFSSLQPSRNWASSPPSPIISQGIRCDKLDGDRSEASA